MLNSDRTLSSILEYLVARTRVLLEAGACVLFRVDHEQQVVVIEAQAGVPEDFPAVREFTIGAGGGVGHPTLDMIVLGADPAAAIDLDAVDPAEIAEPAPVREWFRALCKEYRSSLSVPLMVSGARYGTLGLYYADRRVFSEEDVSLAVAAGLQAALAIENARLRLHVEQAAVLQERSRLARDLHDSVTQSLYSLTLLAEAARRLASSGDVRQVETAIERLGEIGQQALKEMRLLVYELRPSVLRREGLVRALSQRLETVERRAGVEANLVADGWLSLPPGLEEQLYHVAQEALNNALKHAAATAVTVRIHVDGRHLRMEIADNGRGFDLASVGGEGGIGLESMRERIDRLGGRLSIVSSGVGGMAMSTPGEALVSGHGTSVMIDLDLVADAARSYPLQSHLRQRNG